MADNQINFSMDFGDSFKSLEELKKKIVEVQEAMKKASDPKVIKTLGDGLDTLTKKMNDFKNEVISMSTVLKNVDKNVFSNLGKGLSSGFNLAIQSVNAMSSSTENLVNLLKQAQGLAASTQMNTAMGSGSTSRPSRPGSTQTVNTPDESSVLYANATAYQKLQTEFKLYHDAILNARTELELLKMKTVDFTNATENEKLRMQELNRVIDENQVKMNKVNEPLRNVEKQMGGSNVSKYKNELFSLQQVFREIPAFAYGAQTGLMALSNNLPILADDFMKVANATKTAEGGTANYGQALKTFVGGLFSWQTAMVAGVTVLTLYGAEIWDAITGTKTLTEEQKKQAEAIRNTTLAYDKQIGEVEYYNSVLQAGGITEQQQIDLLHQIEELTGVDLTVSYNSMTKSIEAADMATKYHIETIREEIILQTNKQKIIDGVSASEDAYRKSLEAGKELTGQKAKDFAKLKAEMDSMSKSQLELIANNQYIDKDFGKGTDAYKLLKSTFTDLGRETEKYAEALVQQKNAEEEIQKIQNRSNELIKKQKGSLEEKEKSAANTAKSVKQNAEYELGVYGKLVTTQKELNIQLTGGLTDENKKRIEIAAVQYEIKLNQEILHNENIRREKLKAKAVELNLEKTSYESIKSVKKNFSIDELKTLKDMNVITQSTYDLLSKSYGKSEEGANKAKSAFSSLREELKGIAGSIQEAFSGNKITDNIKGGGKTTTTPLFMKPGAKTQLEKDNIKLTERLKELQAQLNNTILKGDDKTNKERINKRKLYNDETLSLEKMLIQDLDALEELRVKLLNSSFEKEVLLVEEKYDTLIRKANERYDQEMEILRKIFDARKENIDQEEKWQTLLDNAKTQKEYDATFKKYEAFRKGQDVKFETFKVTDNQGIRAMDLLTKQIVNLNKNMQKELSETAKKAALDRYNFEKDFNKELYLQDLVGDSAKSIELRKQQEKNFTKDLEGINKDREFQYRESANTYTGLSGTQYNIEKLDEYKSQLKDIIADDPASALVGEYSLAIKALEGNLTDFKNVWDEGQQSYDKFYKEFLQKDAANKDVVKKIEERSRRLKKAEDDFYNKDSKYTTQVDAIIKEGEEYRKQRKELEKQQEVSSNQVKDARREIEKLKRDKEELDKPGFYDKMFNPDKVEKYNNKIFSLNSQINEMIKMENSALKDKLDLQQKILDVQENEIEKTERQGKLVELLGKDTAAFAAQYKKDVEQINKETNVAIENDKKISKDFDEKTKGLNKNYLRFKEILKEIEGETPSIDPTIKSEQFKEAFTELIKELNDGNPRVDVSIVPQLKTDVKKSGVNTLGLTTAEKEQLRKNAEERYKQAIIEEERLYQGLVGQGTIEVKTGINSVTKEKGKPTSKKTSVEITGVESTGIKVDQLTEEETKAKNKKLKEDKYKIDGYNRELERQQFEHEKRMYQIKKETVNVTEEETIQMHIKEVEMLQKNRKYMADDFRKYADSIMSMAQSVYDTVNAYTSYMSQIANDKMALQDQLTQNAVDNYDREIAKIQDIMNTQTMSDAERINSTQKVIDIQNEKALLEKNQKIANLELQKKQIEVNKKMALAQAAISGGIALANVVAIATEGAMAGGPAAPFIFAAELGAGIAAVGGAIASAKTSIDSADLQTQTIDAQIAGIESSYQAGLANGTSATSKSVTGPSAPLTTFNASLVNQGQSNANYNLNGTLGGYKIYVTQADIQNANNQATKISKKVTFG
jgi:hypothetical protein